jgi:protein-S-isoprenylcysteine O-methyltransferase Ste14
MTSLSESASPPAALPWPQVLLIATLPVGFALNHMRPLPWFDPRSAIGRGVGLVVQNLGMALSVWTIGTMQRHGTATLSARSAEALVTDGPFRFHRNPLYFSYVLMLLGVSGMILNAWFAVLAVAYVPLVTWLAVLPEERHLEARFGDAYRDYKARTRRWI